MLPILNGKQWLFQYGSPRIPAVATGSPFKTRKRVDLGVLLWRYHYFCKFKGKSKGNIKIHFLLGGVP